MREEPLKILFCWSSLSGYMVACWRALSALGVQVHVIARAPDGPMGSSLKTHELEEASLTLLSAEEIRDAHRIAEVARAQAPNVVVIGGWWNPAYRALVAGADANTSTLYALAMDNPLRNDARQRIGRIVRAKLLRRFDVAIVPGERAYQMARMLGFREGHIIRALYGVDYALFERALSMRLREKAWPQRFLFAGQLIQRKGVDLMIEAYADYRLRVEQPWEMVVCGAGPLKQAVEKSGVKRVGFIEPAEMPKIMAGCGVFVMPSRYDAWPLAIVEACASGLPVLATEACGSAVELIRAYYNGLLVRSGSAREIADAMEWFTCNKHMLPDMGHRSQRLAAPFGSHEWAYRLTEAFEQVFQRRPVDNR